MFTQPMRILQVDKPSVKLLDKLQWWIHCTFEASRLTFSAANAELPFLAAPMLHMYMAQTYFYNSKFVRSSLGQLPASISLQVWVSLDHFCGQSKHIVNWEVETFHVHLSP
jgi:hypothetical protein